MFASRPGSAASALVLAAGLAAAGSAQAAGFLIQEQSTRGAGRAFSGEAADTGAESLWWNPAAIARSPREVYGDISGIFPDSDVRDRGSTLTLPIPPAGYSGPVGGDPHARNPILPGVVPVGGVSLPIGDRFAVGLSTAAPFNFTTKYGATSFARYEAEKSRLNSADIQLTGAWRATPWLDLGLGLDAVYTSANLTQASPNLSPVAPDGRSALNGDGWAGGYTVGAQVHPTDRFNIGLSYRSSVKRDLYGDVTVSGLGGPLAAADTSTHGKANFKTPWIATLGGRYRLTPRLTLNAQVQRIGWSEFSAINIRYPGQVQVVPQNYRDTTTAAGGVDFAWTPRLTVRAGVQYDPTPTPEPGRTLRVPDSDRWLASTGATYKLRRNLELEGAVEYVDFVGASVNSNAVFYGGTPAQSQANDLAEVTGSAVVVSSGFRWRF